jgi:hypothetical protein
MVAIVQPLLVFIRCLPAPLMHYAHSVCVHAPACIAVLLLASVAAFHPVPGFLKGGKGDPVSLQPCQLAVRQLGMLLADCNQYIYGLGYTGNRRVNLCFSHPVPTSFHRAVYGPNSSPQESHTNGLSTHALHGGKM